MITAITGANGHLGANLVHALLKEKRPVRALINQNRDALDGLNVEIMNGDVCDPYSLIRAFKDVDVVYHLAAVISLSTTNQTEVEAVNVKGTHNVVQACLETGVRRLIHFSSIHALEQKPLDKPVDEMSPLIEADDYPQYDLSKAAAEREVRQGIEQGLDAVILNPTAIIGPYDYRLSHMGEVILALAKGKLPALVEGGFDWVDARDVTLGAIYAEERAPTGAKYLLSGHWATVCDLAEMIEQVAGTPAPRFVCPAWLARTGAPVVTAFNQATRNRQLFTAASIRALTQCNKNISHARATRELLYQPRPLRQTIFDTLNWFQEIGLLDRSIKLKTG